MTNYHPNMSGLIPVEKGGKAPPGAGKNKSPVLASTILKKLLNAEIDVSDMGLPELEEFSGKKLIGAEVLAIKVFYAALQGDTKAIDTVFDRTEGKAIQKIENDQPLVQLPVWVIDSIKKPIKNEEL